MLVGRSERAFRAGKRFGNMNDLESVDTDALFLSCPVDLRDFFDVFKYGCQSSWRRRRQLPGMIARDLEVGDSFRVSYSDEDGIRRICVANDTKGGVRFSFTDGCGTCQLIGSMCLVELLEGGG